MAERNEWMTKLTNEITKDVCLSSMSKLWCNNVFSHVSIIVGSDVSFRMSQTSESHNLISFPFTHE